jgi:aspartate dehydrogenase
MTQTLNVGIAGYGTIGRVVGRALARGIEGLRLTAIASGDAAKTRAALAADGIDVPVVEARELARHAEIVVECAPTAAFTSIATAALKARRTLVTVSGAAILRHPEIVELARARGGHILLATGALLGLDAVRAAAEGTIHSVRMVTRKPPASLLKTSFVIENRIDVMSLTEPLRLFAGSAREGARLFPASVNVAAALGLAGIGADRTELEIWADPTRTRNTHDIVVDADSARFTLQIENVPTLENPGTGRITALSVIAALRGLNAPLRVGT